MAALPDPMMDSAVARSSSPTLPLDGSGGGAFVCPYCTKQLASKHGLIRHIRCHTGDKPFACQFCPKTFADRQYLVLHTRSHTGERPYNCAQCDKRFSSRSNLMQHVKAHEGVRPYECPLCWRRFTQLCGLKCHARTHTGERPFACRKCGRRFAQLANLKKHYTTCSGHVGLENDVDGIEGNDDGHDEGDWNDAGVDRSGVEADLFEGSDILQQGEEGGENSGQTKNQKDVSNYIDVDRNRFGSDEKAKDATLDNDRNQNREERFFSEDALNLSRTLSRNSKPVHVQTESSSKRSFQSERNGEQSSCDGLKVLQPGAVHNLLDLRRRRTTDVFNRKVKSNGDSSATTPRRGRPRIYRPLEKIRPRRQGGAESDADDTATPRRRGRPPVFGVGAAVGEVGEAVVVEGGGRVFRCKVCAKHFSTLGNLRQHASAIHSGVRAYSCPVCQRAFNSRGGLLQHAVTHTNARPYKCDFCFKSFNQSGNLTTHRRIHTGEKPFSCRVCGKAFSNHGNMKTHAKTHRGANIAAPEAVAALIEPRPDTPVDLSNSANDEDISKTEPESNKQDGTSEFCRENFLDSPNCANDLSANLGSASDRLLVNSLMPKLEAKPQPANEHAISLPPRNNQYSDSSDSTIYTSLKLMEVNKLKGLVKCDKTGETLGVESGEAKVSEANGGISGLKSSFSAERFESGSNIDSGKNEAFHSNNSSNGVKFRGNNDLNMKHATDEVYSELSDGFDSEAENEQIDSADENNECRLEGANGEFYSRSNDDDGSRDTKDEFNDSRMEDEFESEVRGFKDEGDDSVRGYDGFNFSGAADDFSCGDPAEDDGNSEDMMEEFRSNSGRFASSYGETFESFDSHGDVFDSLGDPCGAVPFGGMPLVDGRRRRMFYCRECERDFASMASLEQHMSTHTGERRYECTQCGRRFAQPGTLRTHVRTHTGEKPYACTECGRRFAQSGSLDSHMRTHPGAGRYKCGRCGVGFVRANALRRHEGEGHCALSALT